MLSLDWLTQCVPVWAFLVAFATNPYTWSDKINRRISPLLDKLLPTNQ